jgi:ATP-dependent exoDNAse (exonuclease V) alpha subunit
VLEELKGTVERITYYSEEDGYTVARFQPEGQSDLVTVVGNLMSVNAGESLRLEGFWTSHPQYGRQFKVMNYQTVLPATVEGIRKYLGSGLIKGVGPVTAKRIVKRFGQDTLDIIEHHPHRLREVLGVGKKRVEMITRAWEEQKHIKEVMLFLQSHDVSTSLAVKIYKHYGDAALDVVREDPYRLARDIYGIGFLTADKIAQKLGLPTDSPQRVAAGIAYVLSQLADDGHVYAPQGRLVREATEILDVPSDLVEEGVTHLEEEEQVHREEITYAIQDQPGVAIKEERAVYLLPFYYGEVGVANRLRTLINVERSRLAFYQSANWERVFAHLAERTCQPLNAKQQEVVRTALTNKVTVLTGGPGTGKTTTVRTIIRLLEARKRSYALASPTGRAAKRLSEATGREAKTVHRLLEFSPQKGFQRNEDHPLDVDMVIVDEACLTYRQPVLLADGTWRHIGNIVSERAPVEVLSYNFETGRVEPKRVVNWFRYPRKSPFLRINAGRSHSLRSARIIKATPRHKIATPSGWVKAEDLRVGDKVLVRGRFLSPFQRSFALGSLLGDTHINTRKGKSPHLQFVHGEDQIEYLRFKAAVFCHHILSGPTDHSSGYVPHKSVWSVHTQAIDDLVWMYELCYPQGKKTVSDEWLSLVDEVGLAAWFLDDGSIQRPKPGRHEALRPRRKPFRSRSPYALLHTEGFSLAEQKTIQRWFAQRWGLHPRINEDGKGHYFLRFTVSETVKLLDLVRLYTPQCMQWKVGGECCFVPPDEEPPEVAPFVVQSIELWEPATSGHRRYVYDIEVEDNHNYFAGNILVSNSMLDLLLTNHLLKAIDPVSHLLLVGDVDQLPSVGAGNVLRDIIASGQVVVVRLEEIFRQAEGSLIVANAHRINHGQMPIFAKGAKDFFLFVEEDPEKAADLVVDLVKTRIPRKFGYHPVDDIQVLSPMYRGAVGVSNLNARLQEALNPPSLAKSERRLAGRLFRLGDKVMQTRNNYDKEVYNGDIGRVVRLDLENQIMVVRIDDRPVPYEFSELDELVHAFAVSVHKSQGSEYPAVVIPVLTQHYLMLQRNLLYTAVTRAKELVVLVGTKKAIGIAVRNDKIAHRHTALDVRLRGPRMTTNRED